MTILDILPKRRGRPILPKRRGRPPIPTGPETAPPIADRIDAAEGQLSTLEAERPQLALDTVRGVEGAAERLAEVETQIAALETTLDRLRLAHNEAQRQDRAMFAAQKAALYATQVAAVRRHLRARDEAGLRVSAAIENVVSAYRDMIRAGRSARQACPGDMVWPDGSLCGDGELQRLVDQELFRLGSGNSAERIPSFPRQNNYTLRHPNEMVPLPERLSRATAVTIGSLTGRPPQLDPEPAPQPQPRPQPPIPSSAAALPPGAVHRDPGAQAEFEAERARLKAAAAPAQPIEAPADQLAEAD